MSLPAEVKSHHTVWVRTDRTHPAPVRYSVDDDRLVCFGDGPLDGMPSGTRVWASVHEIANGPPLISFPAVLRQVDADSVAPNAIAELLDHVPLGRTSAEVRVRIRTHQMWSERQTHPAIVDSDTFDAAQDVFAGAQRTAIRKERTRNTYVLSGMVRCARCGRKMQGSWNHGQAYYRCKFPFEYAVAEGHHGKTVYVREAAIVPGLDAWIASLFDDDHLDSTYEALAAVSDLEPEDDDGRELDLRRQLKECDTKLARYRQLLEQDADITIAATWIAEVERDRKRLERELGRRPAARKLTKAEIKALVRQLKDIAAVLADADPEDKRAIYDELGVNLTYHPDGRVHVGAGARVLGVRVGGAFTPERTPAVLRGELLVQRGIR